MLTEIDSIVQDNNNVYNFQKQRSSDRPLMSITDVVTEPRCHVVACMNIASIVRSLPCAVDPAFTMVTRPAHQ